MKKYLIIIAIMLAGISQRASAQAAEIEQLLLNLEKLAQFKQILRDMKTGYRILEGGYNTVKDISEGNFNLHKAFLDGLLTVSPAVRNYRRAHDIIELQVRLVKEYQNSYGRFKQDANFNASELRYMGHIYDRLFKESIRNLDELGGILTDSKLRMSDEERLAAIDRIYDDMRNKMDFLRDFDNSTMVLSLQRSKVRGNIQATKSLYGITQ